MFGTCGCEGLADQTLQMISSDVFCIWKHPTWNDLVGMLDDYINNVG